MRAPVWIWLLFLGAGCHLALPLGGAPEAATADGDEGVVDAAVDGAVDGEEGGISAGDVRTYPSMTFRPGASSTHFDDEWDLTACAAVRAATGCDLVLDATIDLSGSTELYDLWVEVGIRQTGGEDFNPDTSNTQPGGLGAWLVSQILDLSADPTAFNANDWIGTQTASSLGPEEYDVPDCASPKVVGTIGTSDFFGFEFDRDGADPAHTQHPLAKAKGTYETGGLYKARLCYRSADALSGTLCHTVNGVAPGFYTSSDTSGMPQIYPAGLGFTGDMTRMQVFVGYYSSGADTGQVVVSGLRVEGCVR